MLEKSKKKTRCDCGDIVEYVIFKQSNKRKTCIRLCKDCLVDLYFEISKEISPRSPKNILNR